ncbi:multicatalytic endopeptidase [Tulasnella sp. 424]|nr:multicatalytic endopeptidase [Tulasnella sp. 424]
MNNQLEQMLNAGRAGGMGAPAVDAQIPDNGEVIHISSLALLKASIPSILHYNKMLKHGRAGVPMEVMGLMLGSFVDEYTVQSFEQLDPRSVAVVVDPIQSVKGKVVIDAFRLINPNSVVMGQEPRQTTSNIGHINKPSIQSLIHGLNRHYYSIVVNYRKTQLEQAMLMNLHKRNWTEGLKLKDFKVHRETNEKAVKNMLNLSESYTKSVEEESTLTAEQLKTRHVGKQDPKRHLEEAVEKSMGDQVVQTLGTMLLAEL